MSTISYTAARENLAQTMDRVCDDHEPVVITRQQQRSVVLVSLEDYKALEETAYLMRSPANARRLLAATEQLGKGRGRARKVNLEA
jgi:antitoxin YefM